MVTRQITKNIYFHELVPKEYLKEKKEITDRDLRFLDIFLLKDIQRIREYFNKPVVINDGKNFNWRGLRTPEWEHFNPNSMHAWWRAYDFHIEGIDVKEVREHIINNRDTSYMSINAIEDDVNWIHVDSRYRPDGSLLIFKP